MGEGTIIEGFQANPQRLYSRALTTSGGGSQEEEYAKGCLLPMLVRYGVTRGPKIGRLQRWVGAWVN